MTHIAKSVTAQNTAGLPFAGVGVSLEACEEYAATVHVRAGARTPAEPNRGTAFPAHPPALSGYRLLTVLGCEIRGR
jgi:hypothetical protein